MKPLIPLLALLAAAPLLAALPVNYDADAADPNPATQGWSEAPTNTLGTDSEPDGLINSPGTVGQVSASPDAGFAWQINDSADDNKAPEYNRTLTLSEQQELYDRGFRLQIRIRAVANHTAVQQGEPWCGFIGLEFPAAVTGNTNRRIGLIPGINTVTNSFQVWEQSDAFTSYPTLKPGGPHVADAGAGSAATYHDIEIVKQGGVSTYSWYLNGIFQQTLELDNGLSFTSDNLIRFGSGSGPTDGGVYNIRSLTLDTLPSPIHVDADATGGNDGTSWEDAFPTLQDALAAAAAGNQIWVAEGTYYPDEGGSAVPNNRSSSFALKNEVAIYGGFAGGETFLEERDPASHPTVLSGDLLQDDAGIGTTDNAYHVVRANNTNPTAVMDGFTITAGRADGTLTDSRGGGVEGSNASFTLRNAIIRGNHSSTVGGALYVNEGSPTLSGSVIEGNTCEGNGGGLYLNLTSAVVTNTRVLGNTSGDTGGGAYLRGANVLTNVAFVGNVAALDGAALGVHPIGGGTLVNATITQNDITDDGGAAVLFDPDGLSLRNCILWGNPENDLSPSPAVASAKNLVQDLAVGGHVISNANPLFVTTPTPGDGDWSTLIDNNYGNLRLSGSSPARNVGDNTFNLEPADLGGAPRITLGTIDLGAHESQTTIYVDATPLGPAPGGAWVDPYPDLQSAINAAVAGGQVWVAEGTYPAPAGSFVIKNGVGIHGGFEGTETALEQRDPSAHVSTLTGQGSRRVVTADLVDNSTVFDGFTITDGSVPPNDGGGGMKVTNSSLVIGNCRFTNNEAGFGGGILITQGGAPIVRNCEFRGNITYGTSNRGGGIYNWSASTLFINCLVSGNIANEGGGVLCRDTPQNPIRFINCTFSGNVATDGSIPGGAGGAIRLWNVNNPPYFVNCLVWNNAVRNSGTSLSVNDFNASLGREGGQPPYFLNCMLANFLGAQLTPGSNNLDSINPQFLTPMVLSLNPSVAGDFRLSLNSPVIDDGINDDPYGPPPFDASSLDLAGAPRLQAAAVDLGAYEGFPFPEIAVEFGGSPLVDNGPAVEPAAVMRGTADTVLSFEVSNLSYPPLELVDLTIDGPASLRVSVTTPLPSSIPGFGTTTLAVSLSNNLSGIYNATLRIASNDGDENPFDIPIRWVVEADTGDTDNDGLPDGDEIADGDPDTDPFNPDTDNDGALDGAEVALAQLGFDNGTDNSALVALLQTNGAGLGLYTADNIQSLAVGKTLLSRDSGTGKFQFHATLLASPDLTTPFAPFDDFTAFRLEGAGQMLFEFNPPAPDAYFLRLSVEP